MVDLQWNTCRVAVDALPSPLFEEIFPHLVAEQGALLVLDARDLGVLQSLGVNPMLEAGWKPAVSSGSIVEAWGAVAEIGRSPAPAVMASLHELFSNLGTSVLELSQPECMARAAIEARKRQSCGLGSRIDPEDERLEGSAGPILQSNRERMESDHDGTPRREEGPSPRRMARHQRLLVLIEHKDGRGRVTSSKLVVSRDLRP